MGCNGLGQAVALATATASAPAVVGSVLTAGVMPGLAKVSQLFANEEKACEKGSYSQSAYNIAKWASLTFAGIAGSLGALSLGATFGGAAVIFSWFSSPTIAITAAAIVSLASAGLIEVQVVKKIWQQASMYKAEQAGEAQTTPSKNQPLGRIDRIGSTLKSIGMMPGGMLAIGSSIAFFGATPFLTKVSQFFANTEKTYPQDSYEKLACKIAKWASLAFGAYICLSGVFGMCTIAGLSTIWSITLISEWSSTAALAATPVILSANLFAAFEVVPVIRNLWQQAFSSRPDPAPQPPKNLEEAAI